MIAYGNVRSNLCRVIANECFRKKIPCYMICSFEEGESEEKETSNSHLMQMLKVKFVKCRKNQNCRDSRGNDESVNTGRTQTVLYLWK